MAMSDLSEAGAVADDKEQISKRKSEYVGLT
jgi:hypothetical protein